MAIEVIPVRSYTFNLPITGSNVIVYSTKVLNGDISRIAFTNIQTPGSIVLSESGTDIEFWRYNNFTSGLSNFDVHPFDYGNGPNNVTGSPYTVVALAANNILELVGSGCTSGTGTVISATVYLK